MPSILVEIRRTARRFALYVPARSNPERREDTESELSSRDGLSWAVDKPEGIGKFSAA